MVINQADTMIQYRLYVITEPYVAEFCQPKTKRSGSQQMLDMGERWGTCLRRRLPSPHRH